MSEQNADPCAGFPRLYMRINCEERIRREKLAGEPCNPLTIEDVNHARQAETEIVNSPLRKRPTPDKGRVVK